MRRVPLQQPHSVLYMEAVSQMLNEFGQAVKGEFSMKRIILLLLLTTSAFAQCPTGATCITIPSQPVSVTFNGKVYRVNIPAQTVPLPALGGSALPAGLTWTPATSTTPGVLSVAGNVSAASISLTGGPTLPSSASGLYLLQQQTTGFLTPVPYVPIALPALSLTQPDPTTNTFTTP